MECLFFFLPHTFWRGDFQNLDCSSVLSAGLGTTVGVCCDLFCSGGAGPCRGDAARDPWDVGGTRQGLVRQTHVGSVPKCGTWGHFCSPGLGQELGVGGRGTLRSRGAAGMFRQCRCWCKPRGPPVPAGAGEPAEPSGAGPGLAGDSPGSAVGYVPLTHVLPAEMPGWWMF